MRNFRIAVIAAVGLMLAAGAAHSATVAMKISGPGAKNDSTIIAGKKVSLDIYIENEKDRRGISLGFKIFSPDSTITTILHPSDSGKGLEETAGDVKGYNGFQNKSIFDLLNKAITYDWDGKLPDQIGFMTHIFKNVYKPHPLEKAYSIDIEVPTPGTLVVDSAFFPPGGRWIMVTQAELPPDVPEWKGPYRFKVVK